MKKIFTPDFLEIMRFVVGGGLFAPTFALMLVLYIPTLGWSDRAWRWLVFDKFFGKEWEAIRK